jgi:transposase-like protein
LDKEQDMEIYAQKKPREKKPQGREPLYTQEYMMMVGKAVSEKGMTLREAARTFGVSHGSVSLWKKMYQRGEKRGHDKKVIQTPAIQLYRLEEHIKELKNEIAELYLENTMLKKALKVSQTSKKENSSVITPENSGRSRKGAAS